VKQKLTAGLLAPALVCFLIAILAVSCASTKEAESNEPLDGPEQAGNITKAGPIYMTVVGASQGPIEGSCTAPGHEGNISVYGLSQELTVPISARTGDPSGRREHNPLTITKPFDKSSPKLYQAFHAGERFTQVTIEFYWTDDMGAEEHYFTIELENAIITSIKPYVPTSSSGDADMPAQGYGHMEEVSFTYKKITWIYEPEGIEYEESWPVAG